MRETTPFTSRVWSRKVPGDVSFTLPARLAYAVWQRNASLEYWLKRSSYTWHASAPSVFKKGFKINRLPAFAVLKRFKKATSNTPLEYIQRVRIEAAKRKLECTTETIMEVMFGIGYNDEKAFRNTFRKYSGLSPKEYQMKYNREMAFA